MTGMLQVFSINVYASLEPGATLSFATPLVARKFDVLPDVLIEPFSICTPLGDSVVAKRDYRRCLIMFPKKVTLVDYHLGYGLASCMLCFHRL